MEDPTFGNLTFDQTWNRTLEWEFLGQQFEVELIVEGNDENEAIAPEQREAFAQLSEVTPRVEQGIFDYYFEILDDFRSRFQTDVDTRMPIIKDKSELLKIINPTGIIFPSVLVARQLSIGFLFECSWDPEEGLGVLLRDGKIEVGTQSLVT